jgi:hypothetical protein
VGERLKLRVVPNLHFHWDKSLETGDHISQLIDQIEKPTRGKRRVCPLLNHPCQRLYSTFRSHSTSSAGSPHPAHRSRFHRTATLSAAR